MEFILQLQEKWEQGLGSMKEVFLVFLTLTQSAIHGRMKNASIAIFDGEKFLTQFSKPGNPVVSYSS